MDPRDVKTAAAARTIVEDRGLDHVKVGVFDMDGVMRGKYMHRDKFLSALDKGFGFCDVVLGWDSDDQLYDSATYIRSYWEAVRALRFTPKGRERMGHPTNAPKEPRMKTQDLVSALKEPCAYAAQVA